MKAVIIFDADNTLWDTDSVFRNAQLALLESLAKENLLNNPVSQIDILRKLDKELFSQLGNFEYNFKFLAAAATYYFFLQLSLKEAVYEAINNTKDGVYSELSLLINNAYSAFERKIEDIPELYPKTEPVLYAIRKLRCCNNSIVTILVSEGNPKRLERILKAHKIRIRNFFDDIIIETAKSKETLEKAKQAGLERLQIKNDVRNTLVILVGDSLKRDIKFGNQVGLATVYMPSPFWGKEEPRELDEQPRYTIYNLGELPLILKNLGILIKI